MLTALLLGIAGGIVLSIPPGPLALAVSKQGFEGRFRTGIELAIGAAAMEALFSLIAAFASSAVVVALRQLLLGNALIPFLFQIFCIVILLLLGIRYLRQKTDPVRQEQMERKEIAQEERARQLGHPSRFFVGVLIAVTNLATPTFLPSIVGYVGYLHANRWLQDGPLENVIYSLGFGLGTTLWFTLVLRALIKHRTKLSVNFLKSVYTFSGSTFILFAAIIIYNVLATTDWSILK